MIIDFHVHGKISSKYSFDEERFLLTINEAKEGGLDSLAITEHCHSENFLEGYEFLNNNYELKDDYFNINGFKVFYGMEVTTEQMLDILIIGKPRLILELREKIIDNLNGSEFIDINKLFELLLDEFLIILAHPYRRHKEFPNLKSNVLRKINAIEFNAKDLYKNGIETMKDKVLKLANKLNIPIVCGSDTHYFIQVSSIKNIFSKDCTTDKEIKEEIRLRNYNIEISSDLKIRVKSAIIIKNLISKK